MTRMMFIQPDDQTAVLRNRQAWLDVLSFTRTREEAERADAESVTKLWWSMVPNVSDARVALVLTDATDNPLLLPEEEALLITEEEAKVQGFYHPSPLGPTNLKLPSLTFTTASPGKAISCVPGTWSQDPAPTYKFQWQADGVDINQAITSTHTVTLLDVGKVLTCVVTATNSKGSTEAVSNECNAIALKSGKKRKR